ncbi:hypothetical protein TNCV_494501 [Trichonephila clavipes]|nr:hypothetical protein TNCV_494501 [Trichonephila clavipes]
MNIRSEYLPFRTNVSTFPITPKRSSSRDVGTSSYRYHNATYSPASVSANRRKNDAIFVASIRDNSKSDPHACPLAESISERRRNRSQETLVPYYLRQ